jgi:translation initiation factor 6
MNILRTDFYGDPNLGLYGFATDKYCLIGFKSKITKRINKALKTPVHSCNVLNTYLLGIFLAGNSSGVIMPNILEDDEISEIKNITNTLILNSKYTALGNLVLMNDSGIILSPLLKKEKSRLSRFFDLPCEVMTIGRSSIVGALALATNKGCLADTRIKDSEMEVLKKVLKVDVDIGTVNFGSPFVKAGLIGNSKGLVVSTMTSGHELGKISEALKMF